MTTIGTFAKTKEGVFRGAIRTLTLDLPAVEIRPVERTGDKAPDHRVLAGPTEVGAAWTVTRPGRPDGLSVRLDDPSFAAPLHAFLTGTDSGYALLWSRSRRS